MKPEQIPILMYHDLSNVNNKWCLSLEKFKQQMFWLKENGYKAITLAGLELLLRTNLSSQQKYVVLTFDDARKSVFKEAFPLLKELGFVATIFVVPNWINGKKIPSEESYSSFMTWEELKQLKDAGFEIGSHSLSHQDLTQLNEMDLEQELSLSKQFLEQELSVKVASFAYPFGKFSETVLGTVKENYSLAVSTKLGFNKNAFSLARQNVLKDTSLENFKKMLIKPKLSLCMITKNEETFLADCLNSVKGLVDEIIVVDTGSEDRTKEIARGFTNKVFDFAWTNDFSAARNEAIFRATGDWVLVLDADEELDKKDHLDILQAINCWQFLGFNLVTRNYSNDSNVSGWLPLTEEKNLGKGLTGFYPSVKVRLFQNRKDLRFSGRIHEQVKIENAPTLKLQVHHYGALKENSLKKENYFSLAKEKLQDNDQDAKAHYELGIQHKERGDLSLAERHFKESLSLDENPLQPLLNLAIVQQKQGKIEEAITNYQRIVAKNTSYAEAYFGLGFCYYKLDDLEKATEFFWKTVEINPRHLEAYVNLGAVCERRGKVKEALIALENALCLNPKSARAYYNLGVIFEKQFKLPLAIKAYKKAVELNYNGKEWLEKKVVKMEDFVKDNS